MGIPVCKRARIAEKFANGDPITHNEIVHIWGLTYIHDGCPEEPVKKGGSKSHTSARTTVKTTRKPSKNAFFPAKQEKNTRKRK